MNKMKLLTIKKEFDLLFCIIKSNDRKEVNYPGRTP